MIEVLNETHENRRSTDNALEEKKAELVYLQNEFETFQDVWYEIVDVLNTKQSELQDLGSYRNEMLMSYQSFVEYSSNIQAELYEYISFKDSFSGFENRIDYLAEQLDIWSQELLKCGEYWGYLGEIISSCYYRIEDMLEEIEQDLISAQYDKSQTVSAKSQTKSYDIENNLDELEEKIATLKDGVEQMLERFDYCMYQLEDIQYELTNIETVIPELRAEKQEKLAAIDEVEAAIDELSYQMQVIDHEIQRIESNVDEYYSYYYDFENHFNNYEDYIGVLYEYVNDGISTDEEWEDAQQLYDWLRMDMEDRLAELDEMLENLFASIQ
jgi:chromosome segregation ATPase